MPGGPATRHLVNAEPLVHEGIGIFVNISRGDVVDEAVLIRVLQEGGSPGRDSTSTSSSEGARGPCGPGERHAAAASGHACLRVREAMGMLAVQNVVAFAEKDAA